VSHFASLGKTLAAEIALYKNQNSTPKDSAFFQNGKRKVSHFASLGKTLAAEIALSLPASSRPRLTGGAPPA